jgi:hypothetical protein
MIKELLSLLTDIEHDERVGVVLVESADRTSSSSTTTSRAKPAEFEGVETTGDRQPLRCH